MTLFHIGQLVTPKRRVGWAVVAGPLGAPAPQYGEIYTVAGFHDHAGRPHLLFDEMPRAAYLAEEFRPLDDAKLDIFRELVAPKPKVEA